jgi:DNA repair photolyase
VLVVRWEGLTLEALETGVPGPQPHLPVALAGARARTFDTPGFRGMTFYEINARTIINRVPEASRVPFRWTVNPYRGCSHACRYCLVGETPILSGDGRMVPLSEIRVGDEIYGTRIMGPFRRYVRTQVLAHWRTEKPAYRITLADGTVLVASGDHRFLTESGWSYVSRGNKQRPHLTEDTPLLGFGQVPAPPKDDAEYRRGYLAGLLRSGRAVADEAAGRSRSYLESFEALDDEARTNELVAWPARMSRAWASGFLGGIFDAAGTSTQGILRITHDDRRLVTKVISALRKHDFRCVLEPPGHRPNIYVVRILGDLKERMRFLMTADPANRRQRDIENVIVTSDAPLEVVSIEPLGITLPMYDITTVTGDFIANGVISHNCFARNTHTYLDLDAGIDFDTKVVVKVNAAERLRAELAAPSWRGEHVAMGTNVDPYQRAEGRYALMPGILRAFRDAANPFSILTKGSLILRDLELLTKCADVTDVGINVSVGFVDRELWRLVEPGTPSPQKRLEVCRAFNDAGIGCGVLMAPVLPYLTDSDESLDATVRAIADAGATFVSPIVLHLRPGAREWYLQWLRTERPFLVPEYEALYGSRAYAPKSYQQWVADRVYELANRYGIGRVPPRRTRNMEPQPTPPPMQQMLFAEPPPALTTRQGRCRGPSPHH